MKRWQKIVVVPTALVTLTGCAPVWQTVGNAVRCIANCGTGQAQMPPVAQPLPPEKQPYDCSIIMHFPDEYQPGGDRGYFVPRAGSSETSWILWYYGCNYMRIGVWKINGAPNLTALVYTPTRLYVDYGPLGLMLWPVGHYGRYQLVGTHLTGQLDWNSRFFAAYRAN